MRLNIRVVVLVVGLAIIVPIWLYLTSSAGKQNKVQFDVFNSSNLRGKISYVHGSQGAVRFRLNGAEETYLFIPLMTPFNGYADFAMIAETEDSVYKPAFADTLILTKVVTKKIYKFTFQPPS